MAVPRLCNVPMSDLETKQELHTPPPELRRKNVVRAAGGCALGLLFRSDGLSEARSSISVLFYFVFIHSSRMTDDDSYLRGHEQVSVPCNLIDHFLSISSCFRLHRGSAGHSVSGKL